MTDSNIVFCFGTLAPSSESAKSEPQAEKEAETPKEKEKAEIKTEETKPKPSTSTPAAPTPAAAPSKKVESKPVVAATEETKVSPPGSRTETRVSSFVNTFPLVYT